MTIAFPRRAAVVVVLALVSLLALGVAPALATTSAGAGGTNAEVIDPGLLGSSQSGSALLAPFLPSFDGWDPGARLPFLVLGTCTGILDPSLITDQTVYDFSLDTPGTTPSTFPDGTLDSTGDVREIGSGWGTWNPQIPGKHVVFESDGDVVIRFDTPQEAVGVVAEPNAFEEYLFLMLAYNSANEVIGLTGRSIVGDHGAAFLGIASNERNIAWVRIVSEPDAGGFAFSDLTYGDRTTELAVPWKSSLRGRLFSPSDSGPASLAMVVSFYESRSADLRSSKFIQLIRHRAGAKSGMLTADNLAKAVNSYGLVARDILRTSEWLLFDSISVDNDVRPDWWEPITTMQLAIAAGHPVIAWVNGADLGGPSGDRWVVVRGFSDDESLGYQAGSQGELKRRMLDVLLNDPTRGRVAVTAEQFGAALMNVRDESQPCGLVVRQTGYLDILDLLVD